MPKSSRRLVIRDWLPGWSRADERFMTDELASVEARDAAAIDFNLELAIAEGAQAVASHFTVRIVTPQALAKATPNERGVLASRATLIVATLDWSAIQEHLRAIVEGVERVELNLATDLLQQHFRWEYDDYSTGNPVAVDGRVDVSVDAIESPGRGHLRAIRPSDPTEVDFPLRFRVRASATDEHASFETHLATPAALLDHVPSNTPIVLGHPALIVGHFEWRDLLAELQAIVEGCRARSFDQTVWRLRRYFALVDRS